jgi:uncharacterized membrane protein YcjF (UPF0283 family)
MKKLFILLLFVNFTLTIFAVEEVTKVSTEVNSIVDNVFDKTSEAVKELSQALKVPAEHVYSILVKQQLTRSYVWTFINSFLLLACIVLWIFWIRDLENKEDWWGLPVTTSVIFIIIFISSVGTIATGFINPEYGAIREIMNIL